MLRKKRHQVASPAKTLSIRNFLVIPMFFTLANPHCCPCFSDVHPMSSQSVHPRDVLRDVPQRVRAIHSAQHAGSIPFHQSLHRQLGPCKPDGYDAYTSKHRWDNRRGIRCNIPRSRRHHRHSSGCRDHLTWYSVKYRFLCLSYPSTLHWSLTTQHQRGAWHINLSGPWKLHGFVFFFSNCWEEIEWS